MSEGIKKIIDPIRAFWGKLTSKVKKIICITAAGLLVLAIGLTVYMNQPRYAVLYAGLKQTDQGTILTSLQEQGVPFQTQEGNTVLVPEERVADLKMSFATMGLPKSAPNYDYFDAQIGKWTTDAERKQISLNSIQITLQQTIESMDAVRSATVLITQPENTGYVLSEKGKPTASVMLDLASELTDAQVNGIKRLIAYGGVPDLVVDNVAVVDTSGAELGGGADGGTSVSITNFKMDIERQFQKDVENSILKLIGPIYGADKIRVVVKSNFNVDKKIIENLTYSPINPDTNTGVLQNQTSDQQAQLSQGTTGGIPGTQTNAEIPGYPNVTVQGDIISTKDAETYNYLVSQVKEQIQHDSAELDKVSVSVTLNQSNMDGMAQQNILQLIATASGALPENITVYSSAWSTGPGDPNVVTTPTDIWKDPIFLGILLAAGGLVVVLFFVLFFTLSAKRKKKKKLRALEESVRAAESRRLEEESLPSLEEVADSKGQALQKEIKGFAQHNPEIAAQLIRTWLRGSDSSGQ